MDEERCPPGLDPDMWRRAHHFRYILDDEGNPVVCEDVFEWARWVEAHPDWKVVARTLLEEQQVEVSTVFLALDHDFTFRGAPVLWETMVFHDRLESRDFFGRTVTARPSTDHQWRYRSRAAAEAGHRAVVQAIREGRDLDELDLPE